MFLFSAPKKEGANESLLDPKEQADDDENVKGQERRGIFNYG